MMGIHIDGAIHIYSDSMSVIENTSKPQPILQQKIWHHTLHKSVAMEPITYIDGNKNPTDLLTKVLCSWKSKYLVNKILHDAYDGEFM